MAEDSEDRKKISLYLHPEDAADRQTLAVIEGIARKNRGNVYRQALISGVILHQLDARIPAVLTAMFTGELDADQVITQISQISGWKPAVGDLRDVLTALGGLPSSVQSVTEPDENELADIDRARQKMRGLM